MSRCAKRADIYAYVGGNPISRIDPFGLTECDINAAVGFAEGLVEREGLSGIDVPGHVSVGELHGSGANVTGATELGYFFRPVTLDNRYLMELTDKGAVTLLGNGAARRNASKLEVGGGQTVPSHKQSMMRFIGGQTH